MAGIHPSSVLEGEIDLAEEVEIGPHCVLQGAIRVGAGTRLLGGVHLQGPLELGERNLLYPGVSLGFGPQSLEFDPTRPGPGLSVGSRNTFREGATAHRAMTDEGPTRIGSDNYFMVNSHAGHDAQIGNHCVFTNNAMLGGHVLVEDRVFAGGGSAVHQFTRIGRGAMLSGLAGLGLDLPPFFTLTATNLAGAVNLVGMRRLGMTREEIADVRWVYNTLYRRGLGVRKATEALRERENRPMVAEYVEFLAHSRRGLCTNRTNRLRGTG